MPAEVLSAILQLAFVLTPFVTSEIVPVAVELDPSSRPRNVSFRRLNGVTDQLSSEYGL